MTRNLLLLVIFSFLISACAPSSLMIKPEDKKHIKTIAIMQIDKPPVRMHNLGSGLAAFGAIGAAAMVSGSDSEKLQNVLKKEKFSFGSELVRAVKKQLKQAGYKVFIVKSARKEPGKLMEDYSQLRIKNADAVLDVVVTNYGYVTEHFMFSPHWRPEARVFAALGKPGQSQALYQETFMYGYHNPIMSGTELDAPEKYHFDEGEDVFKAGNKIVVAGLKDAATKVAQRIASQLRK